MSKIKQIRQALKTNDRGALEDITLDDIRKATAELADDKVDIWTEDDGFRKKRQNTMLGDLLGVDMIMLE